MPARCGPNEDRLTVTVEIPPRGAPTFYRSVIRSNARLTYGQAQRREAASEILEQLNLVDEVASELRRRRFARGALQIATPEEAFRFEDGRVAEAWLEGEPHAHMLVEELMILANEHVAEFLAGRNRSALYRVHEQPDPQSIELLLTKLADLGVPTPPAPDKLSPQTAAVLAGEISARVAEYVAKSGRGTEAFPSLVLRALKQARYDSRNLGHSGLASTAYCHFTSPIRRYPDLVVHRALLRELGLGDDPVSEDLPELAAYTSARERDAAQIEYLADDICLAWLLEDVLLDARLGRALRGRDHRDDRLRPLRPLRRRLRGLSSRAAAARRVLRAERDSEPRSRGRRSRTQIPARRPDHRARRIDRQARRQGRARARLKSDAARAPTGGCARVYPVTP